MKPPRPNPLLILGAAGTLAYPLLVYFGLLHIPPFSLVMLGFSLLGLRIFGLRNYADNRIWVAAFLGAGFILFVLLMLNAHIAVKAYPILTSLAVASVFGSSLVLPPPIIERFARYTEPNLPAEGVVYTKYVTWVWFIFLLFNALISTATALWGSLALWTLWNGLISYMLMSVLFFGEMLVRNRLRQRIRA